MQPLEFRPSLGRKLFFLGMTVGYCFFILIPAVSYYLRPSSDWAKMALGFLLASAYVFWPFSRSLREIWHSLGIYLRVEESGVFVRTRSGERFVLWNEIAAFETRSANIYDEWGTWDSLIGHKGEVLAQWERNWVHFANRDLRLRYAIEDAIRSHLPTPPTRESPNQIWQESARFFLRDGQLKMRRETWPFGVTILAITAFLGFLLWHESPSVPLISLTVGAFSIVICLSGTTITADETSIQTRSIWRRKRLFWRDVARIAMDEGQQNLVFFGKNGERLALGGPSRWSGLGRLAFLQFVEAQSETLQISFDKRAIGLW